MNIFIYDYKPKSGKIALISINDIRQICTNLNFTLDTSFNFRNSKKSDLLIGHFSDSNIEALSKNLPAPSQLQVVICVTKNPLLNSENFKNNQIVENGNFRRAILYVKDMNAINISILESLLSITFDDANKIIKSGGAWVLGWPVDPFNTKKEALVSLNTLCQGYLAAHKKESLESLYSLTKISKEFVNELPDNIEAAIWMDIVNKPNIKKRLAREMRLENIDECCIGTLFESINKRSIQPELVLEVCQFIRKQLYFKI
jgi:hypothetical protein